MSDGNEVPEEFYFAAALTFLGATCGEKLKLKSALNSLEPRLYTVLLGASGDVKKSTALRNTSDFFESVWSSLPAINPRPGVCHGVGSAEGLAKELDANKHGVILCFDELKVLIDKSKIQSSTLLPMTASLFEQTKFENSTKNQKLRVEEAHLSIVGCCTTETYSRMWTPDAIAIGIPNRLFVVSADRKRRVGWPKPHDQERLAEVRREMVEQLGKLPLSLDMTDEAKHAWQIWYENQPSSVHAKRLETIGVRLLGLIALSTNREIIDLEAVEIVVRILDYEFNLRTVTDPIDADSKIAQLEEKIRRQLSNRGTLTDRQLRQYTNANRDGLWAFDMALQNLHKANDIRRGSDQKWAVVKSVVTTSNQT
jgi:hypothetical protein